MPDKHVADLNSATRPTEFAIIDEFSPAVRLVGWVDSFGSVKFRSHRHPPEDGNAPPDLIGKGTPAAPLYHPESVTSARQPIFRRARLHCPNSTSGSGELVTHRGSRLVFRPVTNKRTPRPPTSECANGMYWSGDLAVSGKTPMPGSTCAGRQRIAAGATARPGCRTIERIPAAADPPDPPGRGIWVPPDREVGEPGDGGPSCFSKRRRVPPRPG